MIRTFTFLTVLFSVVVIRADEPSAPDYVSHVAPLLKKYCAGCHNDADLEGDVSLESYASLQRGTPSGPAMLAGDSSNSRIIRLITAQDEPTMPPEGESRPSEQEINLLKDWIDAGAKGPAGAEPDRLRLIVPRIESQADVRPITALDTSPDGQWVAVARNDEVLLFPFQQHELTALDKPTRVLQDFPGKVTSVHFTSDSTHLVTASGVAGLGGVAAIWNVADGTLLRQFKGHRDILYDAELSPDSLLLATCSYDKSIVIWDAQSGEQLRTLDGHNGAVYDIAFSPDSKYLVSASADDTCKVWRTADGARLDTLGQPLKEAYTCQFSPDGRYIVAAGADNSVRVWRFVSRNQPRINPMVIARFAHEGPIVRIAFTQDGSRLVSVAEDRTIKVWDTSDYSEIESWGNQSDVAAGLAVAADGTSLLVGRMDGSLQSYLITKQESAETSASNEVADAPMSDVGPINAAAEQEPNDEPGQATLVRVPAEISGVIQGSHDGLADSDLFRFDAQSGQQWVIEVNAARSKSPLDSFIEVLDSEANRIERARLQAVRDSYFTFRGKDDSTADDFRVFNWEEMRLNEYLYASGEVVKLWLYPRGPDSGFMVYPGQGNRWGYFDTTPLSHALGEPCYIVQPHPPGTTIVANGLPVFPLYYENDDDARRELGKDSRLYFTAPYDGQYHVRIKDVRGFQGEDFKYKLTIRPRQPDFKVSLSGANPTVGAGSAKEFTVKARRIDDYEGPIRVDITGLPPGFSVTTPLVIEAGQLEAMGVVWAVPSAPQPTAETAKSSKVIATGIIWGQERTQPVGSLGEIKLGDPPKLLASIAAVEGGAQPVALSAEGPLEFEIAPGETIRLKVQVQRDGYNGNASFGKEGAGRNLPFGVYVDNIGLNGLLIPEKQNEREFFITADASVPEQTRHFHLKADVENGQATRPVILHVRRPG